jgi:hypothetical protein
MSAPVVTPDLYLHALELGDDELAEWYAEQLDRETAQAAAWYARPDALLRSALHYVARYGLHVFPLSPGSKIPLSKRLTCCYGSHRKGGFLDASDHPDAVRTWWAEHPTANLGIATGHRVDVIDQDGPTGARHYARGEWPAVLGVVTTVRDGGVHRYIAATGEGNGAGIVDGIDFRGIGGYVVAPPSVIDGKRYAWVRPLELGPVA